MLGLTAPGIVTRDTAMHIGRDVKNREPAPDPAGSTEGGPDQAFGQTV